MYPRLFELGPVTVYTYGVLLAAAYLFGLKLAMVRAKARGLDANRGSSYKIARNISVTGKSAWPMLHVCGSPSAQELYS